MNNRLKISLLCFLVGSSVFNVKCGTTNGAENDNVFVDHEKNVVSENDKNNIMRHVDQIIKREVDVFNNRSSIEEIGICLKLTFTEGLPYIFGFTAIGFGFLRLVKK